MSNASNDDNFYSLSGAQQIDAICDRFELAWLRGERTSIEKILAESPAKLRNALARELVAIEMELRRRVGENPSLAEYAKYSADLSFEKNETTVDERISSIAPVTHSRKRIRYFGDYELIEKVARGGMGTVFRATQLSLNRTVAIKMISTGQFASPEEITRFYSEAKAAASLDHPNIVPVYEVGEFEGEHFYSMAFVEGQSLADKLKSGPLETIQAASLLLDVAVAVQYAHDRGVIHRDLKPSNILLDQHSRPRVTDFGLAKIVTDTKGITVSGEILGTPSYMAPEQAAGAIKAVGFAADVYSLGAVLYSSLSGRPPFQAATHVATLKQVIENEPVQLRKLNPAIPRDLETISHKCLDKSISRRYPSPKDLAADLERFLTGQPIHARPVNIIEQSLRWCRRNPAVTINIVGAAVFACAALAGWSFLRAREKEVAKQEQAASIVEQLNVADESELPHLVQQARQQSRIKNLLQNQFDSSKQGSTARYRAAIGLLPGNEAVVREVCFAWLDSNWAEWIYIRNQLSSQLSVVDKWTEEYVQADVDAMEDSRLARFVAIKAAVSKESLEPTIELSESDWERVTSAVMQELLRDPSQLVYASEALVSIHNRLDPGLARRLDYERKDLVPEASLAARMLSQFLVKMHDKLMEIGANSKSEWIPVLFGKARDDALFRNQMLELLKLPIRQESWNIKIADSRARAIAATLLFTLGEQESVWRLLCQREDTTVRALIIEWLPTIQGDPVALLQKASSLIEDRPRHIERVINGASSQRVPNPWLFDDDSSLLRAVLKTIGNYPPRIVQRSVDESFWIRITERYEFDPDPGVHSTCEWLLRRLDRITIVDEISSRLLATQAQRGDWSCVSNGHSMAILRGPIDYEAGSNELDPYRDAGESTDPIDGKRETWSEDHRHPKRIDRTFMIALHETRFIQMHAFDTSFHEKHNKSLGPKLEHPACRVSWRLAAAYCNWLSLQENIPEDQWCFVKVNNGEMGLAPNYLQRRGYRLPTEAEWEYACRAGSSTRTYLGDSEELLLRNVWYVENAREKILSIPGTFKPNGLGLFDMLGNVEEWCMDGFDNRNPESRFKMEDRESPLDFELASNRIVRGGSIYSMPYEVRAAEYSNFFPSYREGNIGFRVARTILD